jgi:hypothetical protein
MGEAGKYFGRVMQERYRILVGKPEGKRPTWKTKT